MAGHSSSGMGSSSASSTPTRSDSTMPSIDNDTIGCVGVGTQNPSLALPPKPKKSEQTSMVWEHFTKVEGGDPEDPKSQCNYCKKLFSCHSKRLGTSSMLTHLKNTCKKYSSKFDKSQSKLSFEVKREGQMAMGEGTVGNLVITKYNAGKIREAIAKMIIKDELPFRFVEGEGFRDFMNIVEPRFSIPSRYTVMKDCIKLFLSEKEKLRAMFMTTGVRVCLTTDTWTSVQNLNYMVITSHFIDSDWNLHKRIINFCLIPNHKADTIGEKILSCMLEWGIRNIFTITVDNASTNDAALEFVKRRTGNKEGAILESRFMHIRCCAHILNLIVTDGLKEVDDSIVRVRSAVKYVKSSPARFEKFKGCIEREQISFKGLLCLDVSTRWNSTFLMLEGAEKCQSAFQLMEEFDKNFKSALNEEKNEKEGLGPPTCVDWNRIRIFLKFLKLFYDATMRLSGSLYCTSNMYFQEVCGIQMHLQEYINSDDFVLSSMAERMMMKYNKYWGDLENNDKVNLMMFVAVVLDPRTKLESLEYWFKDVLGDKKCEEMVKKLKSCLNKLYDHYNVGQSSSQVQHGSELLQGSSMKIEETESANFYFMNR
ncbi:zinc finger BED domain-containing protein RICESLEEPER 2-like [Corylus avellana]|uniref:zinc finger BED domain-containing protein RICESLEEPER 2-like n=1 Tax=Corylus avellana TaxID=13451 RepID=UPI00286A0117|nr:zinc finger BED domain-containing protein RICESLEEPER 2-like [Corylus avellana]